MILKIAILYKYYDQKSIILNSHKNNMSSEKEIILKLKGPLKNYRGETFKDHTHFTTQQMNTVSQDELNKVAPIMKLGDLITNVLKFTLIVEDSKKALLVERWARKIYNKIDTEKAELHVDEKDLKELLDLLENTKINPANTNALAPLIIYLQQKQTELNGKLNPKSPEPEIKS